MEGTMGHLLWSRYPLVPLVSRFTIMGDLSSLFKKKNDPFPKDDAQTEIGPNFLRFLKSLFLFILFLFWFPYFYLYRCPFM